MRFDDITMARGIEAAIYGIGLLPFREDYRAAQTRRRDIESELGHC
jgi:hypothetical protein